MNVLYKKQVWKVITPEDLHYPKGIIRNVVLEKGKEQVITNIKQIKKTTQQTLF